MIINNTIIEKIEKKNDFTDFIKKLNIKDNTIIIKPNWVNTIEGSFTEKEVLELFFEYFKDKRIVIIESYSAWRNQYSEDILSKNSSLLNAKKKWDLIKDQDNWFLENKKIKELIDKYNVKYINITEEVWSKRVVDAKVIKKIVASKYDKLKFEEFYSYIPTKLFDLKDSTLISLSKIKTEKRPFGISASTKNLFGLIPDPSRYNYHGENQELIPQSILDINKIYRSLFNCVFIVEGIYNLTLDYIGSNPKIIKNWGKIIAGRNSSEIDAISLTLMGKNYLDIEYLDLIRKNFGDFNINILKDIPKELIKTYE
jgi:uncharacterized protein (DUF362 family)